jgi:hypothetical protein
VVAAVLSNSPGERFTRYSECSRILGILFKLFLRTLATRGKETKLFLFFLPHFDINHPVLLGVDNLISIPNLVLMIIWQVGWCKLVYMV